MPSNADITLALLAGGAGRRMGMPKAWLRLNDQPILEFLADRLAWAGPTLLVTAPGRERPPGHERFDREVTDPVADEGPLRGVMTALDAMPTSLLLVSTVDMPNVAPIHLRWLVNAINERPDAAGLMLRHQMAGESIPQIEPFPCVLRPTAAPTVAAALAAGRRSTYRLTASPDFVLLDAPVDWSGRIWLNLNTPEDLADWEATARAP